MFHMQERQLLLSSLFKKSIHNAISRFPCLTVSLVSATPLAAFSGF